MSVHKPWTAENLEKAAKMWNDGQSYTQIGKVFGVSRSAIAGIVARNPESFTRGSKRLSVSPWTEEEIKKAVSMYEAGYYASSIARKLKRTTGGVASYIKKHPSLFVQKMSERTFIKSPSLAPKEEVDFYTLQEKVVETVISPEEIESDDYENLFTFAPSRNLSTFRHPLYASILFGALKAGQCKFIYDGLMTVSTPESEACGGPVHFKTHYCSYHHRVVYRPKRDADARDSKQKSR